MTKPVVLRGILGWGNRKGDLEAYGPGGRWADAVHPNSPSGDLLGDALERAGASEGATLLVIAVERFGDLSVLDRIEAQLTSEEPADGVWHTHTTTDSPGVLSHTHRNGDVAHGHHGWRYGEAITEEAPRA